MFRKFFSIGLIAAASFVGLCDTSDAGHHRRGRHAAGQNCCCEQQSSYSTINSGYSGFSGNMNSGYGGPSSQYYGSNGYGANDYGSGSYGNSSGYGRSAMGLGFNGNAGSRIIGNGMILGR